MLDSLSRVANIARRSKCKSVLLIYAHKLRPSFRDRVSQEWQEHAPHLQLEVWDSEQLDVLVQEHAELVDNIVNDLTTLRLKSVVEQAMDWQGQREPKLNALENAYSKGSLSLFLGAGVSIAAGLPDWNKLLDSLFVQVLTRDLSGN